MKKTKIEKGITLVALIITIIILLVLAVTAISAVSDSGIIRYAQRATKKYKKATLQEELTMIMTSLNLDIESNPDIYTVTEEEAEGNGYAMDELLAVTPLEKIKAHFEVDNSIIITEEVDNDDGTTKTITEFDLEKMLNRELVTITKDENTENTTGFILKVPCTYKDVEVNIIVTIKLINETTGKLILFELEELEELEGASIYVSSETVKLTAGGNIKEITSDGVPIPAGFYYVTGTKDTGVVISTSELDENNESGNNGNQFVWVPVNINPVLNITLEESKTMSKVQILSTDGYDETITVNSDFFEKTIPLTKNGIYEIIITYADGTTKDILRNVDSVYAKPYDIYEYIESVVMLYNSYGGAGYTIESFCEEYMEKTMQENPGIVFKNKIEFLKIMQESEFGKYSEDVTEASNVLGYGGFYVGRYEVATDTTIKKGKTPKASITYEQAVAAIESESTKIIGMKLDLPSSASWTTIANWLIETKAKTRDEIYFSSTNWGNYSPKIASGNTVKSTGSRESYKANNIYDLAGNLQELTKEFNTKENAYVARGSDYRTTGYPNVYSRDDVKEAEVETGFRPILYFTK